ncbi:MAG: hypothetical protein ACFE0O_13275 [Opitutales bacterium]
MRDACPDTLILVYNADEGFFNAITDTIHKVLSPKTYECRFCYFTCGTTGMLLPWKTFLESRPETIHFYHRDQFRHSFPEWDLALPAILGKSGDDPPEILISAADFQAIPNLESLIDTLESKLTPVRQQA